MKSTLSNFQTLPLKDAARQLLAKLGYKSDKLIAGAGSSPQAFLDLFGSGHAFDQGKALFSEWKSADLLFQLTDEELSRQSSLFKNDSVQTGLLKSYVFIAIDMKADDYARGKFSAIARQINRLFPMPVMVFFRHQSRLTIAVINRRRNKVDESKDVLGKVTLISGIDFAQPHRGHLDILDSLALHNLVHPQKKPIADFDTLHEAWEHIFNVELLNERFYRELANWYFWALPQVEFPADLEKDEEKRNATGLIRLLTRIIFCWFLKEKNLIPEKLFHPTDLAKILKGFDPESETSSTYYQAILQNLFFATLNQRMGKDSKGHSYRTFAKDEGFHKNKTTYDVNNLYRYESLFRESPEDALAHFADIPFLNGGLFECLDRTEDDTDKKRYLDGFSRNARKRPKIPDRLFFDSGETADLSDVYFDKKRKAEKVTGLIQILNRYKFTIVENTPIDQEIALDPELLGKVFENLLASYNEETKTTARKQTGSFYTPRPIVDYMVDESLKAHFTSILVEKARMKEPDARAGLDVLFTYTEQVHPFSRAEVATLITAIDEVKILDPACGSGAFPMGALHKLVYILGKLDRDNERWKETQLAKLDSAPMREELERAFDENDDDYGRKLYLIENCLYGVDIQPIAIQITKLRFFISLICDQKTNRNKRDNLGIRPLPNLETKFVAADSLIGLPELEQMTLAPQRAYDIEKEIEVLYHNHFSEQRRDKKLATQRKIKNLRTELVKVLSESLMAPKKAKHIADWDAFDPQASADFFDPHWMFGSSLKAGFDVVIQNPPYISHEKLSEQIKAAIAKYDCWEPFADIYCYFIERAIQLLRPGGVSCSITSNSFLRADYGEPLRKVVTKHCSVRSLISIDKSQVFANAIVNVAILLCVKSVNKQSLRSYIGCRSPWEAGDFEEHIQANSFVCSGSSLLRGVWSLSTTAELEILHKVETGNKSLAEHNAKIRLGLATGSNDAFIVGREMRDHFIGLDSKNNALLKPVIRGRDVDRYRLESVDQFLILSKNGVNLPREYPILADHLKSFGSKFRSRGAQGENWWNLRACAFYDDFEVDRVVWIEMTNIPRFAVCPAGVYMLNTAYFLLPPSNWRAHALVALLNSAVSAFFMKHSAQTSGMGVTRWIKSQVSRFPIPSAAQPIESILNALGLMRTRTVGPESSFLEDLIDACVMQCYFLEHMAERDLLFHDTVAPHLAHYNPAASEAKHRDFLHQLHTTLNAPSHPIRNRLLRLTADSPDLLAVIKQEGRV